ncbi:hypothetical protein Daus18300_004355 [Diaporthe australafricana]|uniref:Uncharacterized protein n=1 Tax=Diaporthe australafricana TaxID=127596 RepID=A0ABR3X9P6_9PEZI
MAQPLETSPSSTSANIIDPTTADDDEIITSNRMIILELEQKYILSPGVLTIAPSGQLHADLSQEEPDQGTMAGLYPTLPPPEELKCQIPSWLRDYLIKELNVFGQGPPSACGSLFDQMKRSKEVGREGTNMTVGSTALLLSCATTSLRGSIDDLRDFCSSGEAVCEDSYAMEFGIVERVVGKLAGCDTIKSLKNRLADTEPSDDEIEYSPSKRRRISRDTLVGVFDGGAAASRELPRDIELLIDLGSRGMAMKSALDNSLEDLVITPVSRLVDKLENVYKGLRKQEQDNRKEELRVTRGDHSSDSGISACSP